MEDTESPKTTDMKLLCSLLLVDINQHKAGRSLEHLFWSQFRIQY